MADESINRKLNELDSNNDLKAAKPTIPVRDLLKEADQLYDWCQKDKEELIRVSLDWSLVEDLPVRTGALRAIDTRWTTEFKTYRECNKVWKAEAKKAKALRKELEENLSFVLRRIPQEYARVQEIKKGYSNADMIQDLAALAELGTKHIDKLKAIQMDMGLLEEARLQSSRLGNLSAKVTAASKETSPALVLRNKAYYHLKEAVDEIREAGKFALRKDEDRRKGYYSEYFRSTNRRKTKKTKMNKKKKPGSEDK